MDWAQRIFFIRDVVKKRVVLSSTTWHAWVPVRLLASALPPSKVRNYPNPQSLSRPASGSAELPLANSVRRWLRQRGAHRGAMAEYLDSFLDFISIELLGCALPRQRRVEPAVTGPVDTVCRVAVCAPRPLRTVLYVLRRRAAAARGWDAPHALLVLRRLALVHIGARWSTPSNRVARATKCLTHPCDLWHHRPSNRRSRSTETQLPRGAMVMSSVDKTGPAVL